MLSVNDLKDTPKAKEGPSGYILSDVYTLRAIASQDMTEPKRVQASVPQFMEEQQMDISQLPIELIPLIVRFVNEVDEGTDAIDIETDLAARKPSYPFKTL